ncbi:MAG TPA: hypothetical protein PLB01_14615 [Thermoanaerobaculia bacterium]|nr:hypothetical protein [Thermoanaerobaculia bacterium]
MLVITLLTPLALGDEISNWAAPPYWMPPGGAASQPANRDALAGRQPLAGGPNALPFISLFPCRLVDTRAPVFPAPLGGGWLPPATVRSYTLAGVCNVPANAQAISLNATVVKPTGPGFLTLYPEGGAFPPVSTLNYLGNDIIVNAAVVPLSVTGGISVVLGVSGGDVILDTNGYYATVPSVTSVNTLAGDLTLAAGSNVTITPSAQTLSIAAVMPSGAAVLGKPGDTTLIGQGFTEIVPMDREVWTPTSLTNAPAGRFWHCSVWTGTKMFVWGGQDATQVPIYNSGGLYDPATDSWAATSTGTNVPSARRYAHCVWTGSEVLVWGGEDASLAALNTGGRYNPVANTWAAMTTASAPAGRFSAAVVWAAEASPPRMLVWGGLDRFSGSNVYPSVGGAYNPASDTWSALSTGSQPAPRAAPVFVWTGAKLVLWGGYIGAGTCLDTGGRYDPASDTWAGTAAAGLGARYAGSAVWTGTRMIVWGGTCGAPHLGNGALYDPVGDAWTAMTNTGAPTARYNQVAVWTGSRMIVWSGMTGGGVTNTGGIYDPAGNTWRTMTTTNAPVANYGYTGHWTGLPLNEMVVWGGYGQVGGTYRTLSLFIKN